MRLLAFGHASKTHIAGPALKARLLGCLAPSRPAWPSAQRCSWRTMQSVAASAGFPTPAERNRQLARRLKEALAAAGQDESAYEWLKRAAADFRAGRADAQDLVSVFFSGLGWGQGSVALFQEMAELLPTPQLYGDLMAALREARAAGPQPQQPPQPSQQLQGSEQAGQPLLRGPSISGPQQRAPSSEWSKRQQAGKAGAEAGGEALVLPGYLGEEGIHPNSQSARPARRLTAAKRTRGAAGAAAASAASPSSEAGGGAGRPPGVLLWLRQDLRLHDHPALCAAAADAKAAGGRVTLVYVHSPGEDGDGDVLPPRGGASWRPGAASLVWVQEALRCLDSDLRVRYGPGAGVVFRRGPYAEALLEVAVAAGAGRVYFSRRYEPAQQAADERVQQALAAANVGARSFPGYLLREPAAVRLDLGKWHGHFGTLMPFVRAADALGPLGKPLPPPPALPVAASSPADRCGGEALEGLGLARMPVRQDGSVVDWAAPIRAAWGDFSEAAALAALERFIAVGLGRYERDRGFADGRCVTRLSPFLHWGQLSPRLMLHRLTQANCKQASKTFWRRLYWRDLAYWQLHHWPRMAQEPIRSHYALQEWVEDPAALRAWQRGQTGFPLVDAGMRELWATGWMQQNARMAAACLLTEYLNLSWVHGARWFHDTLVDGDLAINAMMWANAGKAGLDQWNFTVLPTSKAMDPDGSYIRRWVPELARLPGKYLHAPWEAPESVLQAAGVVLGQTYPRRLTTVDLKELRSANTAAINAARAAAGSGARDAQGYDLITLPQGSTLAHDGRRWRVFTKPEYRGGAGEGSAGESAQQPRAASSGRRGGRSGGQRKADALQKTLLEFVAREAG